MNTRILREIMARYGVPGTLYVGAYLLVHHVWHHKRARIQAASIVAVTLLTLLPICMFRPSARVRYMVRTPMPAPVTQPAPKYELQWQPESSNARHKLDAAERMLSQFVPGPPTGGKMNEDWEGDTEGDRYTNIAEAIQESLAIEPSGRAYCDLGKLYLRNGEYEEAIAPLMKAIKFATSFPDVRASLTQARYALHIQAQVSRQLPKKQELAVLSPIPVKGRQLWAVLSSERREFHSENALISVFEAHGKVLSLLWRSQVLASIEGREFYKTDLWAFPMTGRKVPELIFMGPCTGGSAEPTRMLIYHWTGRAFRQVLDTDSEEQPLWIEDLRHTGRYQVRCVHLVGKDLSHGAQVRWPGIYDWNGKRFVEADEKYPEAFRSTRGKILDRLQEHPDDPALLKYLGKAYLYEGQKRQAWAAFQKMERACLELIQNEPDDVDSWWNLGDIAQITGKRSRAVQCFRKAERISLSLAKKTGELSDPEYYKHFAKDASDRIRNLQQQH